MENHDMLKKRTFFILLCLCLIGSLSYAQIKIDVKTPREEKGKSRFAKAGLISYLRQSEWASVVTFDEDFAIWLKNYRGRLKGNVLYINLDVELHTRATLKSGKLLASKYVVDSVDLAAASQLTTFEAREMYRLVTEKLQKGRKLKGLTNAVGALGSALVETGLKYFGVELEGQYTADQAVEGMVIGALLITELKPMIDAAPPPQKKKK